MFARASLYFLACTTRNRALGMLRKLRQPKYLIGLTLTIAYFWFIFFASSWFRSGESAPGQRRENVSLILAGFYVLQVVITWFALSSGRGVAFREAEVQQLFPRPFTRWQVLILKWLGAQFPVVIGALIVGFMFQRFGTFHYGCVSLGFLLNSTVLYANATLVGLWLARLKANGGTGARLVQLPAWLLLATIIVCVALGWQHAGGARTWEEGRLVLASPTVAGFLLPFTTLADVMTSADFASFATAAIYPVLLIAVQGFLIWRIDFQFEDQAVEIAQKIQNLSKEGMAALRSKDELIVTRKKSPWELAPTGPAWRALVWKNIISIGRVPRRTLIRIAIVVIAIGAFLTSVMIDDGDATTRIGFLILVLSLYASLLAPSFVRVDLRIDIPHFDVLKAMPLRGRSLLLGEIMGTVTVMWVVQMVATVIASLLIKQEGDLVFAWSDKVAGVAGLACAFFAMDFILVTSENLLALWMPGYVRLGRGLRPGFDQMGQNLIGALIRMLVLMVTFLAPVTLGVLVGVLASALGAGVAPAASLGTALGAALLVFEAWLLIIWSEGRYERFDITSEKIIEEE